MMGLFKKSEIDKVLKQENKKKKHTLLLVDDEAHNLLTLTDLLQDAYDVITASNGLEALEFLRNDPDPERIHLIISDQRMPQMTGVEFLQEAVSIVPKTKRILMTGYTDVEAIIGSINQGKIFKYISKPFEQHDMLMDIKLALNTYELEIQNETLVKDLQFLNQDLEQKVKQRTSELEEALGELHAINTSKDRFFSVLAHDLKNPLHAFILTAEILVEDIQFLDKMGIKKLAKNLFNGSQKLYRLLENLLYWSQQQLKEGRFHPSVCQPHCVTSQVTEILDELILQKEIEVVNNIEPKVEVWADKNMVEVILRNLISNAIKFSHTKGKIYVTSQDCGEFVEISVQDLGVGITKANLSKLFHIDEYFTTRGTNAEKGTGIGLLLCEELAKTNGGSIRAESILGESTIFTFTLPKQQCPSA